MCVAQGREEMNMNECSHLTEDKVQLLLVGLFVQSKRGK